MHPALPRLHGLASLLEEGLEFGGDRLSPLLGAVVSSFGRMLQPAHTAICCSIE